MQRFPQCLFKPGTKPMAGLLLDSIMVSNDDELAEALEAGWFESPEAADAHGKAEAERLAKLPPESDAKPTRDELEQMAVMLNISFSPRMSDKKLGEAIAAKRAEKAAA
jgi:hypothetical protein